MPEASVSRVYGSVLLGACSVSLLPIAWWKLPVSLLSTSKDVGILLGGGAAVMSCKLWNETTVVRGHSKEMSKSLLGRSSLYGWDVLVIGIYRGNLPPSNPVPRYWIRLLANEHFWSLTVSPCTSIQVCDVLPPCITVDTYTSSM